MTDLIERLRAMAEDGALSIREACNAINEAADALEAQSAGIAELEQSRDGWKDRYNRVDASHDIVLERLAEALERAGEAEAEAAKLRAERVALLQDGLEALRLAHERENQAVARLRRLVRDAYREGFGAVMDEHHKIAPEKAWEDSKACRALEADDPWARERQ